MKGGEENLQEWLEVVDAVYGGSGVSREAIFVHGSVPQHLLRAFLTDLGVMQEMRLALALYPRTMPSAHFDWQGSYAFMPLLKAEPEKTTRLARFATECVRILEYRARMEVGDESYRIASISEAHRYLHRHRK